MPGNSQDGQDGQDDLHDRHGQAGQADQHEMRSFWADRSPTSSRRGSGLREFKQTPFPTPPPHPQQTPHILPLPHPHPTHPSHSHPHLTTLAVHYPQDSQELGDLQDISQSTLRGEVSWGLISAEASAPSHPVVKYLVLGIPFNDASFLLD